jgi:hypothetical protein
MIKILGRKRIICLAVLTLLMVVTFALSYQFFTPAKQKAESDLNAASSALEAKRVDIAKLKQEFVLLKNQISNYKSIESQGFFNDQNRVLAKETLDKYREVSGVIKADYTVSAGEEIADERAKEINYMLIKSPITIDIESIDDADFYNFLRLIIYDFPGRTNVMNLTLERTEKLTDIVLKDISVGKPVALMKGNIKFDWYSMKKNETVSINDDVSTSTNSISSAQPLSTEIPPVAPSMGVTP